MNFRKIAALSTLLAFIGTNSIGPTPAAYSQTEMVRPVTPDLLRFTLPAELGKVQEKFFPPGSGRLPFVIYIQDAHTVYDAQKSIQGVINHLQKSFGLPLVALEGAVGPLDPTLFRTFPIASAKESVFDRLIR